MKKFFRTVHLYLSLAAGLVILMSCITGAILVFEEEVEHLLHHHRFFVKESKQKLPISLLAENAKRHVAGAHVGSIKVYSDPQRTTEINLTLPETSNKDKDRRASPPVTSAANNVQKTSSSGYNKNTRENKSLNGRNGEQKKKPSVTAYTNPYTGEVTEVFNRRGSFFFTVEMLHRWLLTGKEGIGKTVVGVSAFFFLFILLTGLVLWWPKTKKILLKRTQYSWNEGWKRTVHDLHVVTGFYLSIFLIIIVTTGLVMAYNWVNKGIFAITGSTTENAKPPFSEHKNGIGQVSIDELFEKIAMLHPHAQYYNIRFPQDSVGTFAVNMLKAGAREPRANTYYFDQYTSILLGTQNFSDKNTGQKIRAYVKPIHTGAVFGWPTKILSFLICMVTLSFPITGLLMWLYRIKVIGRKKKIKHESVV